jgi:flagellar biosynthetic protein FliO
MALEFLKTMAVLALVLGLIFGLAYLARKFKLGGTLSDNSTPGWRVLGTKMLGPKRQIVIMEVGTKLLLIGMTDKAMTPLMELDNQADKDLVVAATSKRKLGGPKFQDFLRRAES